MRSQFLIYGVEKKNLRTNGVEAAIARYGEAGTKKDARNRNCAQMGSAYLGVLLYIRVAKHPLQEGAGFNHGFSRLYKNLSQMNL